MTSRPNLPPFEQVVAEARKRADAGMQARAYTRTQQLDAKEQAAAATDLKRSAEEQIRDEATKVAKRLVAAAVDTDVTIVAREFSVSPARIGRGTRTKDRILERFPGWVVTSFMSPGASGVDKGGPWSSGGATFGFALTEAGELMDYIDSNTTSAGVELRHLTNHARALLVSDVQIVEDEYVDFPDVRPYDLQRIPSLGIRAGLGELSLRADS